MRWSRNFNKNSRNLFISWSITIPLVMVDPSADADKAVTVSSQELLEMVDVSARPLCGGHTTSSRFADRGCYDPIKQLQALFDKINQQLPDATVLTLSRGS